MIFNPAITVLLLLETSVLGSEYVPVHKRVSYDVTVNDSSYPVMLSRRDTCSDAFGSGAQNSVCAPDFTLCCTRSRQDYPSCEKHLGKGWCCIAERDEGKCYVDQESVCDDDSSVSCTNLQEGTSEACCPKLTTCDPNVEASEAYVRCNINRGDLLAAGKAEQDTAVSTSETISTKATSTTVSVASGTSDLESQPTDPRASSPAGSSSSLSSGAIGGVVVGAVAGAVGIAGLLFWLLRRRRKAKDESTKALPQPSIPQHYHDQMEASTSPAGGEPRSAGRIHVFSAASAGGVDGSTASGRDGCRERAPATIAAALTII